MFSRGSPLIWNLLELKIKKICFQGISRAWVYKKSFKSYNCTLRQTACEWWEINTFKCQFFDSIVNQNLFESKNLSLFIKMRSIKINVIYLFLICAPPPEIWESWDSPLHCCVYKEPDKICFCPNNFGPDWILNERIRFWFSVRPKLWNISRNNLVLQDLDCNRIKNRAREPKSVLSFRWMTVRYFSNCSTLKMAVG